MTTETPTTTARRAALNGLRDMSPIIVGMVPFGLVAGIAAVEAGLPGWGANAFSVIIFAGAAQIAALDLIGQGASPLVVIGTVAIINARFIMYSAGISPAFQSAPVRRRAAVAYLLTDQAFALSSTRHRDHPDAGHLFAYYVGGALSLWTAWQAFTALGVVAGAVLPSDLPIAFAIPLCFLALLVPAITDRGTAVAAVTSGLVAAVAADLPANSGLLLAAMSGIVAGVGTSRRAGRRTEAPAPVPAVPPVPPVEADGNAPDRAPEDAAVTTRGQNS